MTYKVLETCMKGVDRWEKLMNIKDNVTVTSPSGWGAANVSKMSAIPLHHNPKTELVSASNSRERLKCNTLEHCECM
jgi:hypothetical protein